MKGIITDLQARDSRLQGAAVSTMRTLWGDRCSQSACVTAWVGRGDHRRPPSDQRRTNLTDADGPATLRAVIGQLAQEWRDRAKMQRRAKHQYPDKKMAGADAGLAYAYDECADDLDAALAAVLAVRPLLEETKEETRVDGVPEGAHGDLPRPPTR